MSLANSALSNYLGILGAVIQDDETAGGPAGSVVQAGATSILGEALRVTRGGAGTSLIQKSVLSGDAAPGVFIINDGPNSINVFPAVGEFNNGGANQVLAIPAGQSAFWLRVPNNLAGASSGWRSSVIP